MTDLQLIVVNYYSLQIIFNRSNWYLYLTSVCDHSNNHYKVNCVSIKTKYVLVLNCCCTSTHINYIVKTYNFIALPYTMVLVLLN